LGRNMRSVFLNQQILIKSLKV